MAYAMLSDFKSLRISNWIPLALIVGFAIYYFIFWQKIPITQHVIYALIVLVVGFFLFAFKLFGAADIKLIFAIVLWAGPQHTIPFIFFTSLFGGIFAFLIIITKRIIEAKPNYKPKLSITRRLVRLARKNVIPYGIAIGLAALLTVVPNI